MAQKDVVHDADITGRPANHHSRNLLIVMGIAVIMSLVGMWVALQPETKSSSISSGGEAIAYTNALEMQYAQPWLDTQRIEVAPVVQYTDALEMQYAQPWLDAQQSKTISTIYSSNALGMQYVQRWLDAQQVGIAPDIQYTDALAMQYAQPWLDAQQINMASTIHFSNALEMLYAQPWLDKQQQVNCNGRLDEMYACQYK